MKKIEIYTMNHCPYCVKAKALLKKRGLAFREILVDRNDEKARMALLERSGMRTLPQIYADDQIIGGCSDLEALDLQDNLASLGASA